MAENGAVGQAQEGNPAPLRASYGKLSYVELYEKCRKTSYTKNPSYSTGSQTDTHTGGRTHTHTPTLAQ